MKVITVATEKKGYFYSLQESCRRNGYDLIVLGMNQNWEGFGMKFRLVKEFLETIDPEELVVVVDAYDVIMLQPSHVLHERFQAYPQDKILFGKEDYHWLLSFIYESPSFINPDCYINSGVYIGRAGSIKKLLSSLCKKSKCAKNIDDQHLLNMYQKQHDDRSILIDVKSDIIYNFSNPDTYCWKKILNRFLFGHRTFVSAHHLKKEGDGLFIIREEGDTSPVVFHASGNANMDSVCDLLGLPKEVPRDFHSYHGRSTLGRFLVRKISYMLHFIFAFFVGITPLLGLVFNLKLPLWFWFGMLVIYHGLTLQWHLLGECVLTDYENYYNYEKVYSLLKIPGVSLERTFMIASLFPFLNSLLVLWLVYKQYILPCQKNRKTLSRSKIKK